MLLTIEMVFNDDSLESSVQAATVSNLFWLYQLDALYLKRNYVSFLSNFYLSKIVAFVAT